LVEGADPDFAVTDLAGLPGSNDGISDLVGVPVVDDDVEAKLGDELDFVFGASVDLGVAALASVPSYFGDRHALDPGLAEGFGDGVEFVGFDDGAVCPSGLLISGRACPGGGGGW